MSRKLKKDKHLEYLLEHPYVIGLEMEIPKIRQETREFLSAYKKQAELYRIAIKRMAKAKNIKLARKIAVSALANPSDQPCADSGKSR